jgi:hypothetical protein
MPMRTQGWKVIGVLYLVACAATSRCAQLAPVVFDTVVPGIVITVTAERSGAAAVESADRVDSATFHIRDRHGEQQVDGGDLQGPWNDVAYRSRLHGAIRWDPPYLLIERHCAGNTWACNGMVVFRVRHGTAKRLGYLGGETALLNSDDSQISKGRFREIYDRFETGLPGAQHLFSHAVSPSIIVYLRDSASGLVVDRRGTCDASLRQLPVVKDPPPPGSYDLDIESYFAGVARMALAQRYCHRAAMLKRTFSMAQRNLSSQDYAALKAAMEQVMPFEAPFASRRRF